MKENYIYPVIIEHIEGLYRVKFIDFPDIVLIEEESKEDAIKAAQESLALAILDYESQNKELPIPNDNLKEVTYLHIWLPYFRNMAKEIYVKKNVTIPQWLDILAKGNKVNYSAALVKGLKIMLGIEK